jgi:purine-binding chemotaxis protein CheW
MKEDNIELKTVAKNKEASEAEEDLNTRQIIVFKVAGSEYAASIDAIKEVVLTPEIVPVPLMPSYLQGVANVRGNVLAIIDLQERFRSSEADDSDSSERSASKAKSYTLVIESEDYHLGILVNDVPNTLIVKESQIDESPSVLSKDALEKSYIRGVIKLEDRLAVLIDVFKVIDEDEMREDFSLRK